MSLFQELRRRNVIRVGLAYAAAGWLLIQLAEIVFEAWAVPEAGLRILITVLAIGLPLVMIFAWVFELTPEGLKRESEIDRTTSIAGETGRRLDRVIIVVLALALGYFAVDKFLLRTPESADAPATAMENTPESTAPRLPRDASVAVLPLRSLNAGGEDAAFAAGMHDGLLTALAQIDALRVVARSSVLRIAEQNLSTGEVAELLQVATVLEGGVQRAGDQLRVSLQLVDPVSESYLWAETFDRQLTTDNIFAVQSEIARAVTEALEATLTESDERRLSRMPTQDLEALEAYFEGRTLVEQRTEATIMAAREAFRRAHGRDPEFAQALAGEALTALLLRQGASSYGTIPRPEAIGMAMPLLERALALAPDDAEVLAVQGLMLWDMGRPAESVAVLNRSLDINPSNVVAYSWLLNSLGSMGELEAQVKIAREMVERDPSSILAVFNAANHLAAYQAAEPGELEALHERLSRLDASWGLYGRAFTRRIQGDRLEAIRLGLQGIDVNPGSTQARDFIALQLFDYGLAAEARGISATLPEAELALASGDTMRALALAQADFEANPSDEDAVIRLGLALAAAEQREEALRFAQLIWESSGRNPFQWPTEAVVDVAWLARATERGQVYDAFLRAARQVVEARRAANWLSDQFEISQAKLALLEGDAGTAMNHLARAIDLGYRDQRALATPVWESVRENLDFLQQRERMDRLIAEERQEIVGMLCGSDALMTWREPAPGTCAEA
ncbi:MAG: hypothetical protein V2I57_11270 [Xanthomonadales bacterium]|jgi:TolB-like protein|nr:hypothetical protein [Xanthomonadales bacterium]